MSKNISEEEKRWASVHPTEKESLTFRVGLWWFAGMLLLGWGLLTLFALNYDIPLLWLFVLGGIVCFIVGIYKIIDEKVVK